jgi:ABC-type lipoprotein release transport system permease subunit
VSLATAALLLTAAASVAAFVPAQRAVRASPSSVLRDQ